jgi:hypothetical protein
VSARAVVKQMLRSYITSIMTTYTMSGFGTWLPFVDHVTLGAIQNTVAVTTETPTLPLA